MKLEPGMRVTWPRGPSGLLMHGVLGDRGDTEDWPSRVGGPSKRQTIWRATDDEGHGWRVAEQDLRPE